MQCASIFMLVIVWCVLHSALMPVSATKYFQKLLGPTVRFYRLFYNVVSALTLIPVALYISSARTEAFFHWTGYLRIIQALFQATAVLLFLLGARRYDAAQFLGLKQIRDKSARKGIADSGELDTAGILSVMRHPWHLAALLLIWTQPLDVATILVNGLLTAYVLIGVHLEEGKLVKAFGEQYCAYQQTVSMLIPYKWLASFMVKANMKPINSEKRKGDNT